MEGVLSWAVPHVGQGSFIDLIIRLALDGDCPLPALYAKLTRFLFRLYPRSRSPTSCMNILSESAFATASSDQLNDTDLYLDSGYEVARSLLRVDVSCYRICYYPAF